MTKLFTGNVYRLSIRIETNQSCQRKILVSKSAVLLFLFGLPLRGHRRNFLEHRRGHMLYCLSSGLGWFRSHAVRARSFSVVLFYSELEVWDINPNIFKSILKYIAISKVNIWSTNKWYQTKWMLLRLPFWCQFQPQHLGTITPSTAQILRRKGWPKDWLGKRKNKKRGNNERSQLWLFFFFLQALPPEPLVTVVISLRTGVVTVQRGPTPAYLNSLVRNIETKGKLFFHFMWVFLYTKIHSELVLFRVAMN